MLISEKSELNVAILLNNICLIPKRGLVEMNFMVDKEKEKFLIHRWEEKEGGGLVTHMLWTQDL